MKYKKYIALFLASLAWHFATAQKDAFEQEIVTVGDRSIQLQDAYRIELSPKVLDSIISIPTLNYKLLNKRLDNDYVPGEISKVKIKPVNKLPRLYNGYLRAGFGNYTTPLAEVYYMSDYSRKTNYGVHLKHLSSAGGINDVAYSGFSKNSMAVFGKHFLKQHSITGKLNYQRNANHFYGVNSESINVARDSIAQKFQSVGGSVGLKSYFKDSTKVNYESKLSYYNYGDDYHANENNYSAKGMFNRYYNNEYYELGYSIDYNSYSQQERSYIVANDSSLFSTVPADIPSSKNNAIVSLVPSVQTYTKGITVKVGMNISMDIDNIEKNTYHFFPEAYASYSLFDNLFVPYVGLTGQVQRNSFQSVSTTNPFIINQIALFNTENSYRAFGGIRGTISSKISFNAVFEQSKYNNYLFFVNDTLFSHFNNQFDVVYDQLEQTKIEAELTINEFETSSIYLKGQVFRYKTQNEKAAWHLPDYQFEVGGDYNIADKFLAKATLFVVGKRSYRDFDTTGEVIARELNGYVDANLGFEYRYTKKLSAFLNFNNLTATRYEIWHKYPAQRFNVMGGVTFSF